MTMVLFDPPGRVGRRRNAVANTIVSVAIVVAAAWILWSLESAGQFEAFRWEQFQYTTIQAQLITGLTNTLAAAGAASVLAVLLGGVLAVARISERAWLSRAAGVVVDLCRAVPMLILMFFFYYGSLQFNLGITPMGAVVLGLMFYNGAVLAEVFRAGIKAVPAGQGEAAYAIGMRKSQVVGLIQLPQAVRAMLPAIVSQLVILLKDTALGSIISFNELLYVGRQMGGRPEFGFPFVPSYLVVAAVYIGICGLLTWLAHALDRRSRRVRRSPMPISSGRPPVLAGRS